MIVWIRGGTYTLSGDFDLRTGDSGTGPYSIAYQAAPGEFTNFTGPAPATTRGVYRWEREHPAIEIAADDAISDNGQEIYNFCEQKGITNIALMGVHTNICILNHAECAR